MERSDSLIKLVSFIVFLAMVIYAGYAAFSSGSDKLRTVVAAPMELKESVETTGWCVRDETVTVSPQGGATLRVSEGQKVAAGAQLAITYSTGSDLRRAEEIRELTVQLNQLREISEGRNGAQSAEESVLKLADAASRRDLGDLDAITLDIEAYLFETAELSAAGAYQRIQSIEDRISNLRISSGGNGSVTAPKAGTFSAEVDGFEYVKPSDITGKLTPSAVTELFSNPQRVAAGSFGKIISGYKWYYVTIMDYSDATRLMGRTSVNVEFSKSYSGTVNMKIVGVGQEQNGKSAVVLSSSENIGDVSAVREMTGEIIFTASSGIRVPREALHLNENGETVVYILRGLQAREVRVEIQGEDGDWYMVTADAAGLREGNEIITRAANLYDGAVVGE